MLKRIFEAKEISEEEGDEAGIAPEEGFEECVANSLIIRLVWACLRMNPTELGEEPEFGGGLGALDFVVAGQHFPTPIPEGSHRLVVVGGEGRE